MSQGLPVIRSTQAVFALVLERSAGLMPISFLLLVVAAIGALTEHFLDPEQPARALLGLSSFGQLIVTTLIAVRCHRLYLLGEMPVRGNLSWSSLETQFLIRSLQITVVVIVLLMLLMPLLMLPGLASNSKGLIAAAAALAGLFSMVAWVRLSPMLPMSALEQPTGLRLAWALTRGNGFRITAIYLLVLAPVMAIHMGLSLIGLPIVGPLLIGLSAAIATVLSIASISICYHQLQIASAQAPTAASGDVVDDPPE